MNTKAIVLGLAAYATSLVTPLVANGKNGILSKQKLEKIVNSTNVSDAYDYDYEHLKKITNGSADVLAYKVNTAIESGFKQHLSNGELNTSTAGALGLRQVMPTTALHMVRRMYYFKNDDLKHLITNKKNPKERVEKFLDEEQILPVYSVINSLMGRYVDEIQNKDMYDAFVLGKKSAQERVQSKINAFLEKGRSNHRIGLAVEFYFDEIVKKAARNARIQPTPEMTVAAYNGGPQLLTRLIEQYGNNWVVCLRYRNKDKNGNAKAPETYNHVMKFRGVYAKQKGKQSQ